MHGVSHANIGLTVATKTPQTATPVLGRGALVGDSMGLVCDIVQLVSMTVLTVARQGKTLTMLALIVATKKDVPMDGHSASTLIGMLAFSEETRFKHHLTSSF